MTEAIQTETMTKTCKTCTETKPVDDFYVNRKAKDGRQSQCRPCMKAYKAKWHAENREHRAAYNAQWRADSPHADWEAQYRRRARAFGFDPVVRSFTREDMLTYWNNGPFCIYCDAPFTEIDHLIPVGLGGIHAVENVAPSCGPCNRVNAWTVVRERRAMAAA